MFSMIPIQDLIKHLREDSLPYSPKLLVQFSDLDTKSLSLLKDQWLSIQLERRRAFVRGLADLAETDPLQLLEDTGKIALDDTDDEVVIAAIDLLFEADDHRLIDTFLKFLADKSRFDKLRATAANALGPYFYKCSLEELDNTIYQKIESQLLFAYENDRSELVKRRVLETLGYCDKPIVNEFIFQALSKRDVFWIESALLAIGRTLDNTWDDTVLDFLNNDDPIILAQAIHAAGLLGIRRAKLKLFKLLNPEADPELRQEAIWALSQIGGNDIIARLEHLAEMTDDEDEIDLIEDAIDQLELFNAADRLKPFMVVGPDLSDDDFDEDEITFDDDEDDEDEFFKMPFNMDEWARYTDEDDFDDDEFEEEDDEFDDSMLDDDDDY